MFIPLHRSRYTPFSFLHASSESPLPFPFSSPPQERVCVLFTSLCCWLVHVQNAWQQGQFPGCKVPLLSLAGLLSSLTRWNSILLIGWWKLICAGMIEAKHKLDRKEKTLHYRRSTQSGLLVLQLPLKKSCEQLGRAMLDIYSEHIVSEARKLRQGNSSDHCGMEGADLLARDPWLDLYEVEKSTRTK